MKKWILPLAILFITGETCKNRKTEETANSVQKDTVLEEEKNYLPVQDFIRSEIKNVDSFYTAILKYTIRGNKTDSAYIKPEEFHQLAGEFDTPDLSKKNLENNYTETSFLDQTSRSVTFIYSTKNIDQPIKRIDVLTRESMGYDKVKSIYLEKVFNSGDTLIVKRIFWKAGRNFLVVTQTSSGSQNPTINQVKVVWDNRE